MTDWPPKFKKVLGELDEEDRRTLINCLSDPQDSAIRITEVLNNHGHQIGTTTIKAARKALVSA